jgi:hypothetical protein
MPGAIDFAVLAAVTSAGLRSVAWVSIGIGVLTSLFIIGDIVGGRKQHMAVMNFVWPLTVLYGGLLALAAYLMFGRATKGMSMGEHHPMSKETSKRPMWQSALLGATHCGAGCMLGDVLTDGGLFLLGASALLGSALLTSYVFDFVVAYFLGIIFQYFAIVPMQHLTPAQGIWAAIKADTFSLIAFQVGMYAWMAIYQKVIFHPHLEANSPVFWFMMQIGMLAGLATALPMNWLLVSKGIKERM